MTNSQPSEKNIKLTRFVDGPDTMRGITSRGGGLGTSGGSDWHFKLCSPVEGPTLNRACSVSDPRLLPEHFDGLNPAGHLLLANNGASV